MLTYILILFLIIVLLKVYFYKNESFSNDMWINNLKESIYQALKKNNSQNLNKNQLLALSDAQDKTFKFISNIKLKWNKIPSIRKKLLSTVGSTGPYGIHSYCDWIIGCRQVSWKHLEITNCWGNPDILPKIIFVSITSFRLFFYIIYPYIPNDHKYIIIIADEDTTVPFSKDDKRYPSDEIMSPKMWNAIITNKQIIHIFCTHLEIPYTHKYSPIPVGFNPLEHPNNNIDHLLNININLDILKKPLKIKGCCRIREDSQWEDRKKVKKLCNLEWKDFSDWGPISKNNFFDEIQNYSFLFCPHGGGIDPNPKAFSAIFLGTIPIMKKFVNCEYLYNDLPVVFIDDWSANYITKEKLIKWRSELKPYFYNKKKRSQVIEKLSTEYWLKKIKSKIQ